MFRNYLKTAIRNLWLYKGFALINITGLTIGIVGCMVISLFVWDEKQYDRSIPGGENIYRIYDQQSGNNKIGFIAPVPPEYATRLSGYAEVDTAARILMAGDKFLVERDEKQNYEDKGWYVEPSFFRVFPLKFLRGAEAKALTEPGTVVISKEMANRYFGDEDPIGKTIKIDKMDFAVCAVLDKLPSHFHLDFHYLMPLSSIKIPAERMESWEWRQFYTYIRLKPGTTAGPLQNRFQAYVKTDIYPTLRRGSSTYLPFFQPLKDIHLQSADFVYDNAVRGNILYVKALSLIALFVLAIAGFNFINLATARSLRRAKEIGIRKVIGADRRQLIVQFLGETILLSAVSMALATIATCLVIPLLNQFTGKSISFNPLTTPMLVLLLVAAGIVIGVLAGIYPALILSGFKPMKVLKGIKSTSSPKASWIRQGLVVVQFTLSTLMIVAAIMVYRQTRFLNNKDLGFDKEEVVYFQMRGALEKNLENFKSEMKQSPGVVAVTSGYGLPGDQFAGDGISIPTKNGEKEYSANVFIGDFDYVNTLGLRIIAGRNFSKDMSTDVREAFLVNETAVRELGLGTPERALGQRINWREWAPADTSQPVKKGRIIGVVRDFHYKSLHEKVASSVIQLYPQVSFKVAVKIRAANTPATLAYINKVWNKYAAGYPLDYKFMDQSYDIMYNTEEKLSVLLWIFTAMAIVVGCMGLFGLAAFSAEQKTREVGIRKVLGAGIFNIMGLLSKNFLLLVLTSSAIALPAAWWAVQKWLEDFPYRVQIEWWIFLLTPLISMLIAIATICFQTIKAALANPVKSLRIE
jgi:putative ABC transport system permease protein